MAVAVKSGALPLMRPPFRDLIPFSDYSRWERRPVKKPEVMAAPKSRPRAPRETSLQWSRQRVLTPDSQLQPESYSLSLKSERSKNISRYGSSLKPRLSFRSQEPPNIRMMKSELKTKRKSLDVYQRYAKDLLAENITLISSIMEVEEDTKTSIDKVLSRYKHFRGAMNTLKLKSAELLEQAKQDLEDIRTQLRENIEAQHANIKLVDQTVSSKSKQLMTLKHYKDKEYPMRKVRIEQLRENREEINAMQADEVREINQQVAEEQEHYDLHMRAMRIELENKATEACLASADKQSEVRAQAIQNKIMAKEIILHHQYQRELTEAITELKNSLACMQQEASSRHSLKIQAKCLPDTEITLNIPTRDRLLPV